MTEVPAVSHNAEGKQFELTTQVGPAILQYTSRDGLLEFLHTAVPKAVERRGYGTALVRAGLDHARASGVKVVPTCPFVRAFMDQHTEYADVRATAA